MIITINTHCPSVAPITCTPTIVVPIINSPNKTIWLARDHLKTNKTILFKKCLTSKNSAERHTNVSMYSFAVNVTTQCKCFNARGCTSQEIEDIPLCSRSLVKVKNLHIKCCITNIHHKYDAILLLTIICHICEIK